MGLSCGCGGRSDSSDHVLLPNSISSDLGKGSGSSGEYVRAGAIGIVFVGWLGGQGLSHFHSLGGCQEVLLGLWAEYDIVGEVGTHSDNALEGSDGVGGKGFWSSTPGFGGTV